jgi:hypothetical protein
MCNHRALPTLLLFAALLLTACGGDAVVYAPTALPPDLSPQVWAHPSGAFSVAVPRHWAVYVQNDATLASASFSPPGAPAPVLTVAAIRVGAALDDTALGTLAAEIQSTHRPDQRRYTQTAVERTPDGAWRFSGARLNPDGSQTPLNTFISTAGGLVALADAAVPTDPALLADVQRAVNTITLNADSPLPPAEPAAFGFIRVAALEAQNTAAWTNSSGVLFVTGEIANHTGQLLETVPVRVALTDAAGNTVIEANDFTMGYHLPAGGFAPFSLRFGQGQPAEALGYRVTVGDGALFPPPRPVMGAPALAWTDSSTFSPDGSLSIMGTVTHTGEGATARDLLGVITVFDSTGDVIGAWFTPLGIASLAAGESADYAVRVPELGGGARNYIIDVQGYGG